MLFIEPSRLLYVDRSAPESTRSSFETETPKSQLPFNKETARKRRQTFLPGNLVEDDDDKKSKFSSRQVSFTERYSPLLFEKTKVTKFLTGSKYIGQWNDLGISGKGIYKFPHGAIYDGYFNSNGEFHGSGMIIYPNGQRIEGFWKDGKLTSGAVSKEHFICHEDYCRMPDRRFQIEVESELQPANRENLTHGPVPRKIPENCYDMGEGFYDAKLGVIRKYENPSTTKSIQDYAYWMDDDRLQSFIDILEPTPSDRQLLAMARAWRPRVLTDTRIECMPNKTQEAWIKWFCRKAWDQPTGFRPDLYETWTSGRGRSEQRQDSTSFSKFDIKSPMERSRQSSVLTTYFQTFYSIVPNTEMSSFFIDLQHFSGEDIRKSNVMFVKHRKTEELNKLLLKRISQQPRPSKPFIRLSKAKYPAKKMKSEKVGSKKLSFAKHVFVLPKI